VRVRVGAVFVLAHREAPLAVSLHATDELDEAVRTVIECYEANCSEIPVEPKKADAQ